MKENEPDNERGEDRFETPARIRPEHIVVNPDAPQKWQRYEIADDTPLGRAKRAGKLDAGGRRGYTGEDRYQAGLRFRAIWDTVHSTSGSTSFERIGGGGEPRTQESICIARDLLKRVREKMAADNYFIVAQFIGEGSSGSEAVKARIAGFEKAVWLAVCMALDDLIDAVVRLGLGKVSRETNG